jgi:hypothetical protein
MQAERNGPLARSRNVWVYNIGMDLGEIGLEKLDCVHLFQDGRLTGECKQTCRLGSMTINKLIYLI